MEMEYNKRNGFACGRFDIMHLGHIRLLEYAKSQCDVLFVGILEDQTLENPNRQKSTQSLYERVGQIEALKSVDHVFTYKTEQELYDYLQSNDDRLYVRILGNDWEGKKITGYDIPGHLEKCRYLDRAIDDYSSTELRQRIIVEYLENKIK
jgi:cytidyltransferase-like protein